MAASVELNTASRISTESAQSGFSEMRWRLANRSYRTGFCWFCSHRNGPFFKPDSHNSSN